MSEASYESQKLFSVNVMLTETVKLTQRPFSLYEIYLVIIILFV